MNYDLEMEKQMEDIEEGSKLLLHACCAPCSSAVLERLANFFKISIFYYNPNITEEEEYRKRINELKRFVSVFKTKYPVEIIEGNYEPSKFMEMAKGLEETAKIAEELGFNHFATTLTLSPHKNANWINEIGEELNKKYKSNYLYSDFKKKEGYKKSIELSKVYNLYRQDYCGCIYSKRVRQAE